MLLDFKHFLSHAEAAATGVLNSEYREGKLCKHTLGNVYGDIVWPCEEASQRGVGNSYP